MFTIICHNEEEVFQAWERLNYSQREGFLKILMELRRSGSAIGEQIRRATSRALAPTFEISCHGFCLTFLPDSKKFQVEILSLSIGQLSCIKSLNHTLNRNSFFEEILSGSTENIVTREMPFIQWEKPEELVQALVLIGEGATTSNDLSQTDLLKKYSFPKRSAQFLSATLEALTLIVRKPQNRGYRYALTHSGNEIVDLSEQKDRVFKLHQHLKSHPHVEFWMHQIKERQPCNPVLIQEKFEKDFSALFSPTTSRRRADSLYSILKWLAGRELLEITSSETVNHASSVQLYLDLASVIP